MAALLIGCASGPSEIERARTVAQARALIDRSLPRGVSDRSGWVSDLYTAFDTQHIEPTPEHVCAVVAVIEQESGFQVNTVVPGLGAIAWREIDERAERHAIPVSLVHAALHLKSSTGVSYSDRIDRARTEKELSDIFDDFIGQVPLGRTLFEDWNPIRTRGPMQVNVAFARQSAAAKSYPYPVKSSLEDELFTRHGSIYFGVAHLLGYAAPYDDYVYRFADFNAGQFSSRNAGFQRAVSVVSGIKLVTDGALLPHNSNATSGSTEEAVRRIAGRLDLSDGEIHDALEEGRSEGFETTTLYRRTFEMAGRMSGRPLPPAVVPHIQLHGAKITRSLTTDWYAHRVDQRFRRCLRQ
ncbi:MAG TPA: DUF1615 domain-containing protein [Steroidobacteraceae bacterium]|nr:DUF1615 domain-containing protein [Steroidobacteraceae bacterium]